MEAYCVPQGLSDPDGGSVRPLFSWLINGQIVASEHEAYLPLSGILREECAVL